jgi:transcriptional regulator with XRE-family HTH domain
MTLSCECGGPLKATRLERFDFSPYAGFNVELGGDEGGEGVPGLKCDRCGGTTLEGETIDLVLRLLAVIMVVEERRLPAEATRYLRRFLELTQKDLAERMGVDRVTVADWERAAEPISAAHDMVLRSIVISKLLEAAGVDVVELQTPLRSVHRKPSRRSRALSAAAIADLNRRFRQAIARRAG